MKLQILVFILIFAVLNISYASAAKISGKVYDISLNEVNDVIVSINTSPQQTFVVKNGSYYFIAPFGSYELSAKKVVNGIIEDSVKENITISDDGDYVIDLILFPEFDDDYFDEINFDVSMPSEKGSPNVELIFFPIFAFLIIISILIFVIYLKNKKKKEEINNIIDETSGDLADKIYDEIKKSDGRITQKELRKKFPYSEAKISLVVSELESKGMIEKIRKGRGNILVIKK